MALIKAKLLAIQAHSGQLRKLSKEPYIIHLFRIDEHITKLLKQSPELDKIRQIAYLHDTIEDTWITYEFLQKEFGKEIADAVKALTKLKQKKENELYLKQLKNASDIVKLIKLFDIYDNINDKFQGDKWPLFLRKIKTITTNLELKENIYKKEFELLKKKILENEELQI